MGVIGEGLYTNFRDLGGLNCPDGKQIKSGKIYRCSKLYAETEEQKAFIEGLNLDAIVDFRDMEEISQKPDYVPVGVEYIPLSVYEGHKLKYIPVTLQAKARVCMLRGKRVPRLKEEKQFSYRLMPWARAYDNIFSLMDEGKTFAFHCTEGKDRTGFAAMLIEYSLGRTTEEVYEEYLFSNICRPNKDRSIMKYIGCSDELIADIGYSESCHEELFNIYMDTIFERYGSIDEYLTVWFGVTPERREKWKELYCE